MTMHQEDLYDDVEEEVVPKKRGRPPGVKNSRKLSKRKIKELHPTWGCRPGENRGGGRKRKGEEPTKTLSISVQPDTHRKFFEMKKRGVDIGKKLEERIAELAALLGIE